MFADPCIIFSFVLYSSALRSSARRRDLYLARLNQTQCDAFSFLVGIDKAWRYRLINIQFKVSWKSRSSQFCAIKNVRCCQSKSREIFLAKTLLRSRTWVKKINDDVSQRRFLSMIMSLRLWKRGFSATESKKTRNQSYHGERKEEALILNYSLLPPGCCSLIFLEKCRRFMTSWKVQAAIFPHSAFLKLANKSHSKVNEQEKLVRH